MKYSDLPSLSLLLLVVLATGDGVIIRADSPCSGVDDERMCAGWTELSITKSGDSASLGQWDRALFLLLNTVPRRGQHGEGLLC